jgi:hypothetical protein
VEISLMKFPGSNLIVSTMATGMIDPIRPGLTGRGGWGWDDKNSKLAPAARESRVGELADLSAMSSRWLISKKLGDAFPGLNPWAIFTFSLREEWGVWGWGNNGPGLKAL